mgnify:CR=1 FL=1|tara:strand:- start:2604 stop:3143 length:540 start_codon:yes stop_codon:yes gene_type:complete
MACNNCNSTSTNCNNLACGCADTSKTMPCVYTDCRTKGAETCEDIQCASCVSYCADSFEVSLGSDILHVANGDRLDRILQRFALFISNASCVASAPQLISLGTITSTSIIVEWSGVPASATVSVEFKLPSSSGWNTAVSGLTTSTVAHTITNLVAGTTYQFRVTNGSCSSVIITGSTSI